MVFKGKRTKQILSFVGLSFLLLGVSSASAESFSSQVYKPTVVTKEKPVLSLLKDDKKSDDKKSSAEKEASDILDANKSSDDDTSEKEDKQEILDENMATVLDAAGGKSGKIDGGGLFYGPIEKASGTGSASLMYSAPALGRMNAEMLDGKYGSPVFTPYISFGYGLSKLRDAGFDGNSDTTADEVDQGLGEFSNVFASISSTALRFVKQYNPLPLVMSLYDNSYLTNGKYSGKDGNKLLDLIRKQPNLYDFFNAMGSPVSGVPILSSFSFTQFIGLMMALGTIFVGLFMQFFGHHFGETVRKVIVMLFVTMLGVPFGASVLNAGFDMMSDAVTAESKTPKIEIASNNLLFADWAETGFAMPEGTSFTVNDGKVQMSKADVLAINKHVESTLGRKSDENAIADRIKSELKSGNNVATVAFKEAIKKDGTKWDTDKLVEAAQKFAKNEEIDPEDVNSIGYLNAGTITASGGDANWTFSGHGGRWGVSPLTAVNVLSGTFDANGYTVGDMNTQAPKIPHVIANMDDKGFMDAPNGDMPGLVKFFLAITAMYALIKTLMTILYASYGGFLKGGLTAAIGSPRGVGELIGSAFALLLGVVGISGIGALVITLGDVIWSFVVGNGFRIDNGVLDPLIQAIAKPVKSIPFFGDALAAVVSSATSFVMSLVACMFVPKVAKMPIEQFGGFCSSLPSRFGELFQNFANRITGDYRGGSFFGGSSYGGNNITHAVDNAMNSSISNLKMASAGAGLMAGATMAMAGRSLEKRLTNNNNTSDHDKDSEYDKSDDDTTRELTQNQLDATTDTTETSVVQPANGEEKEPKPAEPTSSEPESEDPGSPEDTLDTPENPLTEETPEQTAARKAAEDVKKAEAEALAKSPKETPVVEGGPKGDGKGDGKDNPKASEDSKDSKDPNAASGDKRDVSPEVAAKAADSEQPASSEVPAETPDSQTAMGPEVASEGVAPVLPEIDSQSAMGPDVAPEGAAPVLPEMSNETVQNTESVNAPTSAIDASTMTERSSYAEGDQQTSVQSDTEIDGSVQQSQIEAGIMASSTQSSTQAETNLSATKVDGDQISQGIGQGQGQGQGTGSGQGIGQGSGKGQGQSGQSPKSLRSALANAASSPLRMAQSGGQSLKSGLKAHAAKHEGGKVDKSIQAYRMAKTKDGRKDLARGSGLALARSLQAVGGHATFGDFVKGATHVTASMAGHGDMTHRWATKNQQMRSEALRGPLPGQTPQTPEQLQAQQPMTKNQQELRLEEMMGHYPSGYGD